MANTHPMDQVIEHMLLPSLGVAIESLATLMKVGCEPQIVMYRDDSDPFLVRCEIHFDPESLPPEDQVDNWVTAPPAEEKSDG